MLAGFLKWSTQNDLRVPNGVTNPGSRYLEFGCNKKMTGSDLICSLGHIAVHRRS